MQLGLLESLWPQRTPNAAERALEFHAGRFARWLHTAGAEPRFALVLCAGEQAKNRFIDHLEAERVDVVVTSATNERPLPRDLVEHRGDHFNNRLYLVDGFDECNRLDVLRTLNGQRSQLKRTATWAALVIESPETLATLYEVAPALVADVMRRCLVINLAPETLPSTSAPAAQLNRWRSTGCVAEIAFHTACTRGETADYHDISRLLRTGYGTSVTPPYSDLLERCMELWRGQHHLNATEYTPDLLSALARHGSVAGFSQAFVGEQLAERPFCRMAAGLPTQNEAESLVLTAHNRQAPPAMSVQSVQMKIIARWGETAWGPMVAALTAAQVAASQHDVEACDTALTELLEVGHQGRAAPELYFNALEFRIRFDVGLSQRAEGRAVLDILESITPALQSPYYDGRAHLVRGDFIVELDSVMAKLEYQSAERLFSAHGYPAWAQTAIQRQERVR